MEDEIVARIMRALDLRVADIEAERASTGRTRNPEAQDLAFRCAVAATNYGARAASRERKAELLKPCDEALRLDPHNAVALGNCAGPSLDGVERGQSADREGDEARESGT